MPRDIVTGRRQRIVPTKPEQTFDQVKLTQLQTRRDGLEVRFDLFDGTDVVHDQPVHVSIPDIESAHPKLQAAWDNLVNELSHYYKRNHIQQEISEAVEKGEDISILSAELSAVHTVISAKTDPR